jgi:hypothetical protein
MKKKPLAPEQRKARMPARTIVTGEHFAACLRPGELYLKIQALRQCRFHYPDSQPIERERAFVDACQQRLIEPKKAIGLNKETTAYGLVDQKPGLVEK